MSPVLSRLGAPRLAPDLTDAAALLADRGGTLGRPLHLLSVTGSTNEDAKAAARLGAPHGSTWLAEEQTHGRGRRGRAWLCAPGEGLLFSTVIRVSCAPSRIPLIPLLAGLAVRDAVARSAGVEPRLKWPNDVVVSGRKLAGVLVEALTTGQRVEAVIVGIGINVHTRELPAEIAGIATSLTLVAPGATLSRAVLLADTLSGLDRDLEPTLSRGLGLVRARLEAADDLRGRRVRSDGGAEGVAQGIDDEGRLLVEDDAGRLSRWASGEVTLAKG